MMHKIIILIVLLIVLGGVVAAGLFYVSGDRYNYTLATEWGGFGYEDEDGKFQLPYGSTIYKDESGDEFLLISDCHNHNIQKFSLDGAFISKFGSEGSGAGFLNTPADVAVDKEGNIWIVEENNDRISIFDGNQNFLYHLTASFGDEKDEAAATFNLLDRPLGVVLDSANNFYVSNLGNTLVMKFDAEGNFVQFLNRHEDNISLSSILAYESDFRETDAYEEARRTSSSHAFCASLDCTAEAEFRDPYYLVVDSKDNVYVVDRGNHRIQKFDSEGKFLLMWGRNGGDGTPGDKEGEFNWPHEIAIDKNDNVYVADSKNHRIQIFNSQGNFLFQLGDESVFGFPKVVTVDSSLNIYVGDTGVEESEEKDGEDAPQAHSHAEGESGGHTHSEEETPEVKITKWKKSLF